jgi:chromosomal replication initiation ATPase DnaA
VTRLQQLRELRARIDQEIALEVRAQKRLGLIEADHVKVHRDSGEYAQQLLAAAADHYRVTVNAITSPNRRSVVTHARMVAAWTIRTATGMSYPEIGRLLNKDHTTVMNAVKRVNADPKRRAVGASLIRDEAA